MRRSRSAKDGLVLGGEAVDQEAAVSAHQRRGGLQVAGLAFDERSARLVQLVLGRRPAGQDRR